MREILFRGKRIDNGEWVYGDLIRHYENQRRFIACEQLAYTYTECGIHRLVTENAYEVDPDTIGQYTGLTDKNSTKIFEGDIIKHGYFNRYCREKLTAKYIVKWGKCGFGISLACVTEQDICEVIGNIHDKEVAE